VAALLVNVTAAFIAAPQLCGQVLQQQWMQDI
jgi:hypothetical protein